MPRFSAWSAILCALLTLSPAVRAQADVLLSGRVVDSATGLAVPGATVRADGTPLGTAADADGVFSLAVPPRVTSLTVSAVGYARQSVAVAAGPLDVRLVEVAADLQPVVVTASRGEQDRADAPVAIAALSAADLRETHPNLLSEALNRIPGVHMVDLGNEQHALAIRQPLSLKPLFLYLEDGVPIRPAGLFNHNALIEVNGADLARVEVVRGPGSALYGAGAIGGAVNFLTARPTAETEAAASARRSGTGYSRADASVSGTLALPGGRALGLAGGGYASLQRQGVRDHSDGDKVSLSLRAETALAPGTRLTATATGNVLDTDTDGALDSLSFYTGGTTSLQTFSYRHVAAARAAVRLDHVWGSRQLTSVTLFTRANRVGQNPSYRLRPTGPTTATGETNDQSFTSLGVTAQHEVYPGWRGARIVAGATFDVSPSSYEARFGTATRDATGRFLDYVGTDSLLTDYAVRLTNSATFVQGEVEPIARLRLVGSLRYDRIRFDLDNALAPGAFSGAADRSDTFGRLTPRIGAVVTVAPGAGVYANVSQGFVPPEAGELYRGVQVPVLKPAVFTSREVGGFASLLRGRLAADVALYRMDGRDEIVTVRTDTDTQDQNAGRTRHEGVEVSVLAEPVRWLSARVGAALARHDYVAFTTDARAGRERVYDGNRIEKAPVLVANGELAVRPLPGVRVAAEVQRVSGYWMDPENTTRYGGHTVLNLRASAAPRLLRGAEVWANLLNATDARYATTAAVSFGQAQYTPGLPRALTVGLGARF